MRSPEAPVCRLKTPSWLEAHTAPAEYSDHSLDPKPLNPKYLDGAVEDAGNKLRELRYVELRRRDDVRPMHRKPLRPQSKQLRVSCLECRV